MNDDGLPSNFWKYVAPDAQGCWIWTGSHTIGGYGRYWITETRGHVPAHRFSYEVLVGPVPVGLQLDHLCRVRDCVNPTHLEAVTQQENILRGVGLTAQNARKTTCPKGHPLDGKTKTKYQPRGRRCLTCHRESMRAAKQRKREELRVN